MLKLTKMAQNKRVKKVISKFLHFLYCSFCCAPLLGIAAPIQQEKIETTANLQSAITPELMQLRAQLDEWNAMKPALKRLIKSEQDLNLIIAALNKISPLASQPSEQQLLAKTAFTLPKKAAKETVRSRVAPKKVKAVKNMVKSSVTLKKVKAGKVAAINAGQEMVCSQHVAIHLTSYTKSEDLVRGWSVLTHKYAKLFKGKRPLSQHVSVNNKSYIRLLAGNFGSIKTAQKACRTLKSQNQYCRVVTY